MSETRTPETLSADDAALLASIERGLAQAARGEGRVHTPETMARRRKATLERLRQTTSRKLK